MINVKIIIGGNTQVGKSRIFKALFTMPMSDISLYEPTYDAFMSPLILDNIELDIWDLPGSLDLTLPQEHFQNLGGAVLIFDITRKITFANINTWLSRIWQDSPGVPVIIVANKMDLLSTSHEAPQIILQAEQLAKSINSNTQLYCELVKTTASKSKNAFRIFSKLFASIELSNKSVYQKQEQNKNIMTSTSNLNEFSDISPYEITPRSTKVELEDETLLPDLDLLVDKLKKSSTAPEVTIQKITYFLKFNREIRKAFTWLPENSVAELISVAQAESDWLLEKNFFWLLVYKGIESLIRENLSLLPEKASHWAHKFATNFIEDNKTWDMFTDLKKDSAKELIAKFIKDPSSYSDMEMEIYSAYRSAVYER